MKIYYFFRALNIADNADIEQQITISANGKIEKIRTDRERYEGKTKYTEDSEITLEEIYDHIKMHYRKDTNCISLTSNANIGLSTLFCTIFIRTLFYIQLVLNN